MNKKVTNLQINEEKLSKNEKYKLPKKITKVVAAGSASGMAVATGINKFFPNLVQTVGTYLTTKSNNVGFWEGLAISVGWASKPVDIISEPVITAIGAGIGVLAAGTITLVKDSIQKKKEKNITLKK